MSLLQQVVSFLADLESPYAVFGGTAIKAFDASRQTSDVDVLVSQGMLPKLAEHLETTVIVDKYGQKKIEIAELDIYDMLNINTPIGNSPFRMDTAISDRLLHVSLGSIAFFTLSHEDHIVLKAILQRGNKQQKQDDSDITILANQQELDLPYLLKRIELTNSVRWADTYLKKLGIIE